MEENAGFEGEEGGQYPYREEDSRRWSVRIQQRRGKRSKDTQKLQKFIRRMCILENAGGFEGETNSKATLDKINARLTEIWSLHIQDKSGRRSLYLFLPRIDWEGNIYGVSPGRLQNLIGNIRLLKSEYGRGTLTETQVGARLMEYVVGLSLAGNNERIRVCDVREIRDVLYREQVLAVFYQNTPAHEHELTIADGLVQKAAEGTLQNVWDIFMVRESRSEGAFGHRPRALDLPKLFGGIFGKERSRPPD